MPKFDLVSPVTGDSVELEVELEELTEDSVLTFKMNVEGDEVMKVGTEEPEEIDMFFEEMDRLRDVWMRSKLSGL